MNWYIVKIVFNIQINNSDNQSQFDEQLRLVEAPTAIDAFMNARVIGKKEEEVFKNEKGEDVCWKFIDVTEIELLKEFKNGAELYSFTHEHKESDDYINFIRLKAQLLQTRHAVFA